MPKAVSPRVALRQRASEKAELLTYAEVAELLKVDIRTVKRWAADRRLDRVELTAQAIRITAESVNRLIAESMRAAGAG